MIWKKCTVGIVADFHWVILLSIIQLQMTTTIAQENSDNRFRWPDNKKIAVCLTYDDGLDCHLDVAVPALNSYHFRGTFYCTGYSSSLFKRMDEWRKIARDGHELGNHTLFHPCDGKKFDWVLPEYDLNRYTISQLVNELTTANSLLKAIDGQEERTFAYTCSDYKIGEQSFVDTIRNHFTAARNDGPIPENMEDVDIHFVPSWGVIDPSGEELIAYVKEAMEKRTLAVFMFHSVGGGYLNVSAEAHNELLSFLKEHEDEIWVDTFLNVMKHVRKEQARLAGTDTL